MKNLLKNYLKENYQIEGIESISDPINGYLSRSYIVKTKNNQYFLKGYCQRTVKKIDFAIKAMQFFSNAEIPVILPIKTKDNNHGFLINNECYVLFPYIKNLRVVQVNLSPKALSSAGEMLAKIHLAGRSGYPVNKDLITKSWSKDEFNKRANNLLQIIDKKTNKDKTDKISLEKINLEIKLVNKNKLDFNKLGLVSNHLIHGDYHRRQISFDENDNINYVFDFKSKISPRALELARSTDLICFNNYREESFKNSGMFLKGYQSIYPLTKNEIRNGILGNYIKECHVFWAEEAYYLNNNLMVVKIIKSDFEKLKFLSKNSNQIIERIIKMI